MNHRKGLAVALATAAALLVAATAVAGTTGAPKVSAAWARPSSTSTGALYMTVTGNGTADRLVAVAVPRTVAGTTEMHKTSMGSGDMMTMTPVKSIAVPATGSVMLRPGGYHVMLMSLKKPLKAGASFPVTLTFAKAGKVTVTAKVRAS
jgi:periplasmic copper chaperone A